MPAPDGRVAAPYVPTLSHKFYAVLTRVIAKQSEAAPHKLEHIQYITDLAAQGKVFASGPFPVPDEDIDLGLILLRASSLEEAESLMKVEPMTALGLSTYEIHEWDIVIGQMPFTLNVSTGSFSF